jgi:hypothetical protein
VVSGSELSSREELLGLIESQARVIDELTARVAAQEARIAELATAVGPQLAELLAAALDGWACGVAVACRAPAQWSAPG